MKEDQPAVKLAELRAKTDRQVLEYIREQLKAAAQYAFEADQACRTKNFARARRCRERADSAIRLAKELKAMLRPTDDLDAVAERLDEAATRARADYLRTPGPSTEVLPFEPGEAYGA